ncbi:glycerophosphodiester phosphodiesterase [Brachybacterium sp. JHP9]|uniref:Glycerophosphodiester phosphodiesterase n=1 Tax=Brachybacterium equifaecis TaxID=2910770 RepID=A0ABT0R1Y2_9MICO|nr:glycerophosphodiester phosphodiesterase [Brachybacterium equifaecis]MCL6423943.1 glycerophosphodiester phosphodiesterase [Brachybacterium equifaecis]
MSSDSGWTAPGSESGGARERRADGQLTGGALPDFSQSSGPAPQGVPAAEQWGVPAAEAAPPASGERPAPAGGGLARELTAPTGLFPLRPLGLGEILGAAVAIYRRRPRLVLGVSAIVFAISFAIVTLATGASLAPTLVSMQSTLESPETSETLELGSVGEMLTTIGGSLVTGLVTMVAMQLVLVLLARVAVVEAVGNPVSDAELRAAMRTFGVRAVLSGLLTSIVTSVPFVLLTGAGVGLFVLLLEGERIGWGIAALLVMVGLGLLGMLYLWVRTAFATPAIVTEDIGVIAGLRRSFALTAGNRVWRPLGILLLLMLLFSLAQQAVSSVFGMVGFMGYMAILVGTNMEGMVAGMLLLTAITMLGTCIATILTAPFWGGGLTALYADLRMRQESWDIVLRQEEERARTAAMPASPMPVAAG